MSAVCCKICSAWKCVWQAFPKIEESIKTIIYWPIANALCTSVLKKAILMRNEFFSSFNHLPNLFLLRNKVVCINVRWSFQHLHFQRTINFRFEFKWFIKSRDLPENNHLLKRQTIRANPKIDAGTQCVGLFGFVTQLICMNEKQNNRMVNWVCVCEVFRTCEKKQQPPLVSKCTKQRSALSKQKC